MTANEIRELIYNAKSLPELIMKLKAQECEPVIYNSALRTFLSKRAWERGIPISGTFELTPFCNLDCKMCYVHLNAGQLRGRKLLSADDWERVMSEAIDAGMMYATLTGGECLLHPDFERLYLFLHSKGVRVSLLTNGALLDRTRVEFLAKHPPSGIRVTIYGADEDSYEQVTGHRMFYKVIKNIQYADGNGLPLSLSITPNPYLGSDTEHLIRFVAGLGIPFIINSALIEPWEDTGRTADYKDLSPDEYMRFFKLQLQLQGKSLPTECEDILPASRSGAVGEVRGLRCGAGRSTFKVSWDGKMTPCNNLNDLTVKPLEIGFAESWKSVHNYVKGILLPIECESCPYKMAVHPCALLHKDMSGHANPKQCIWCKARVKAGFAKLV